MTKRHVRLTAAGSTPGPGRVTLRTPARSFASTPGCPPSGVAGPLGHLHSGTAIPAPAD